MPIELPLGRELSWTPAARPPPRSSTSHAIPGLAIAKLFGLGVFSALLLLGCGSPSKRRPEAWCPAVPALTTSQPDLTGKANTFKRVLRIQTRYGFTILKRCPDVVSVGIGKARPSKALNDPRIDRRRAGRVSDAETDHLITIGLRSGRHRPERSLLLAGVRVEFEVTGPIRLD